MPSFFYHLLGVTNVPLVPISLVLTVLVFPESYLGKEISGIIVLCSASKHDKGKDVNNHQISE